MSITAPRGYQHPRAHTTALIAAGTAGGLLLGWYAMYHASPGGLLFTGVILIGIGIATAVVVRRQCRILQRLDKVDRQFAHVRMQYVCDNIDPSVTDDS